MESKRKKILITSITVAFLSVVIAYFVLKLAPVRQAEAVATQFEFAVKNDDKELFEDIISYENKYWEIVNDPKKYQHLQNLFSKFHGEIEVYKCSYFPAFLSPSKNAEIFALAKMKAKKDNKHRTHFQIELQKYSGEWKLVSFHFPDFIDY